MIWLTWRQFRVQAGVVFATVAAFGVVLFVTGRRLLDLSRLDANIYDQLSNTDRHLFFAGIVVMAVAPAVVGVFWGAPLVARELEAGTHRLAWNQSVTRTHWLATKLGVTLLAAVVAVGLLTLGVTWWSEPIDGAASNTRGALPSRLTPVSFAMRGIAPIGYTIFALVLGVTLGIVIRRSLPAMALTLAIFAFVQVAVPLWVRPHLVTPVEQTFSITTARLDSIEPSSAEGPLRITMNTGHHGDWILSNETVNIKGQVVALPRWLGSCFPAPPPPSAADGPVRAASPPDACFTRLTAEGYRQRVVYQPANHFWPLQLMETALFLVMSGLLSWFCFWWVRHRTS